MKVRLLLVLVLCGTFLTACGGSPAEDTTAETTAAPVTTSPTPGTTAPEVTTQAAELTWLDLVEPQGTTVDDAVMKELEIMFEDYNSWNSRILTSAFTEPKEINLKEMFYDGIDYAGDDLSDDERAFLETVWSENAFYMDIFEAPVDRMDEILQEYLGISLEDTLGVGLEDMTYWEAGNCYYLAHTDANSTPVQILGAYTQEDGTVDMYYCDALTSAGEQVKPTWVARLQPCEDGYRIVSNAYIGSIE